MANIFYFKIRNNIFDLTEKVLREKKKKHFITMNNLNQTNSINQYEKRLKKKQNRIEPK
jgi:hypothetical protein